MSDTQIAKAQFLLMLGLATFAVGSVIVYEHWWLKALFGAAALASGWLAWVFAYFVWGGDR